ncbi:MAG: hypothetical protein STHCBS139747_002016, partial [Sporothrix thermara]
MAIRFRLPASLSSCSGRRAVVTPGPATSAAAAARRSIRVPAQTTLSQRRVSINRQSVRAFSGGVTVTATDRSIKIASSEAVKRAELPNFWLRDNCRCSSCVNQDTSQRNFDTFEIPADIRATEVKADDKGLNVVWSGDNHKSHYPWDFVRFYQSNDHRSPEPVDFHYWGSSIADSPPTVHFDAVMDTS